MTAICPKCDNKGYIAKVGEHYIECDCQREIYTSCPGCNGAGYTTDVILTSLPPQYPKCTLCNANSSNFTIETPERKKQIENSIHESPRRFKALEEKLENQSARRIANLVEFITKIEKKLEDEVNQLDGALGKIANIQDSMGKKIAEIEKTLEYREGTIGYLAGLIAQFKKKVEKTQLWIKSVEQVLCGRFVELDNRTKDLESQIREINPGLLPIDYEAISTPRHELYKNPTECEPKEPKCFMCTEAARRESEGKKWEDINPEIPNPKLFIEDGKVYFIDKKGDKIEVLWTMKDTTPEFEKTFRKHFRRILSKTGIDETDHSTIAHKMAFEALKPKEESDTEISLSSEPGANTLHAGDGYMLQRDGDTELYSSIDVEAEGNKYKIFKLVKAPGVEAISSEHARRESEGHEEKPKESKCKSCNKYIPSAWDFCSRDCAVSKPKERVEMPPRYNTDHGISIKHIFISHHETGQIVISCNHCMEFIITKAQFQQLINDMQQLLDESK